MPGAGVQRGFTGNDTPQNQPLARVMRGILIDVSRTLSRAGLGAPTGIDRVERAWIERALTGAWGPAWFHARISGGSVSVNQEAMQDILAACEGGHLPAFDLRARLSMRKRDAVRAVESAFRRAACTPPAGLVYANLGHSNLSPAAIREIRTRGAARVIVLIHDVIPLDYPGFARKDGPEKMRIRVKAAERADLVIYNSADTRIRTEAHMSAPPPQTVALLGIETLPPPTDVPAHGGFVTLGTIEPRKNHALLLDLWERLDQTAPPLHIIGRRGWMNEAVFARLDRLPPQVIEHGSLPDAAARQYLAGAQALLFPSFAEGYGLPLGEALALGVPVIASDLAALREVGGAAPLWLAPDDPDGWLNAVRALMDAKSGRRAELLKASRAWHAPSWSAHFARVDAAMAAL